jgi:branched-chain amino acid transport system substrate-binding protein
MQAYYEKYGKEADEYAALGYDSMMMVADAVKRGNSDDSESIAEALGRTMDFPGVTGPIDLDANHDAVKDVFILTFKDSKPVFVEKIPIEVIQGRQF